MLRHLEQSHVHHLLTPELQLPHHQVVALKMSWLPDSLSDQYSER